MGVSIRPLILVGTLLVCGFTDPGKANQDECGCNMACTGGLDTCEDCFESDDLECETVDCPEGMYRCGNFVCMDEPWDGCEEVSSCLQTGTCGDRYTNSFNNCPSDIFMPVTDERDNAKAVWQPPFNPNSTQFTSVIFTCLGPGRSVSCQQDGYGEFPVGITKVSYTATETAGLERTCNFTVTVAEFTCPEDVKALATPGQTETIVTWNEMDISGFDEESWNFSSSDNSGDSFKIGTHKITYELNPNGQTVDCHFFVTVKGQCPEENTADALFVVLNWPATTAGNTSESIERCPLMTERGILGLPKGLRICSEEEAPEYFRWENHTSENCGEPKNYVTLDDVKETQVTEGNAPEVAEFLADETSTAQESGQEIQVETIATILQNIVSANTGDSQVTDSVVEAVNNVIQSIETSEELSNDASSSSAIVQSVQSQITLTLQQEGEVSIVQESLHVEAISRNLSEIQNGLTFASVKKQTGLEEENEGSLQGSRIQTFIDASVDTDIIGSVQLPGSTFDNNLGTNGNTQLQAGFIIYATDALFQSASLQRKRDEEDSEEEVAGPVLSLFVEGLTLNYLREPLVITIKAPENVTNATLASTRCVAWNFTLEGGVGDWSGEGCNYTGVQNDSVSCECNHATNFAVLMDFRGQGVPGDPIAERALQLISQIGIALSIAALIITLTAYLSIKRLRTGTSRQIFIHFCISLLLLYIVFLAGVDNAANSKAGCVLVSALLHYLVLSTMMWMAVEARNMYDSTVKVFPEDRHRYMLKACLIAWGFPLLVVAITVAAATDDYWNKSYCFISPTLTMFLGLLVPIGLVLLHNIVTFILVMRSLIKVQEASRSEQISKRLQNAIGISALMGLTWVFGFLAIDFATFVFQLIFCIANSLQGVVIFIMFFLRRKEVRDAVAPHLAWLNCCQMRRKEHHTVSTDNTGLTSTTGGPTKVTSVANTVSMDDNSYENNTPSTDDIGLTSTTGGPTKVTSVANTVGMNDHTYDVPSPVYETSLF